MEIKFNCIITGNQKEKVLRLPIKKVWFDMIKAGVKTEEYRTIKEYWWKRIVKRNGWGSNSDYHIMCETGPLKAKEFFHYTHIELINGYGKNAPRLLVKCLDIVIGFGKDEWGAIEGEKYFVIKLGKIIPTAAQ